MESDGSLLCSQEPSTGPYAELGESSTYSLITLLQFVTEIKAVYLK
jgi:hypothetical protein